VVHSGEIEEARAWSSAKVPIVFAAVQKSLSSPESLSDDLIANVDAALTMSDNDAALSLWDELGTDEEASAAVDSVFRQAGDPTDAVSDRERDDYEGFGDIQWTLDNQVIFANRMACLTGAERILPAMDQVVAEHRQGLGLLPQARFKGGWGVEPDGSFLLREFGLVGMTGRQIPVAVAVIPDDGEEITARQATGALAEELGPLLDGLVETGGTADCQAS